MEGIAVHISEYLANGPEDSLAHSLPFFILKTIFLLMDLKITLALLTAMLQ